MNELQSKVATLMQDPSDGSSGLRAEAESVCEGKCCNAVKREQPSSGYACGGGANI